MASDAGEEVRIVVKETKPGRALEVSMVGLQSFCTFVEESSRASVIGFFRELARELEQERFLLDFHLKITESSHKRTSGFKVEIFYGDTDRIGPVDLAPGDCISCFAHVGLYPGKAPAITAGDCIMDEVDGGGLVHCSIDAKARPGFIITPLRHVERMSDLDDNELFALWSTAVKALRSEGLPSFKSMILNHGYYRNLPHLHLKVWVDAALHHPVRMAWPPHRQELWHKLEGLACTDNRKHNFYLRKGGCKQGRYREFGRN